MPAANAAAIGKAAVGLALAKHGLRGALVRRKAGDWHDCKWWGVMWWHVEIRSGVLDWLGARPQFRDSYEIDTSDREQKSVFSSDLKKTLTFCEKTLDTLP